MSLKFTEQNVPRNFKVNVVHLHEGNSARKQRKGKKYYTQAVLVHRNTGEVMGVGEAYCSNGDQPVRSIGRHIAVGRALKNFMMVSHSSNYRLSA